MQTAINRMPRVLLPASITHRAMPPGEVVHTLTGTTMGTTWQVRLAGSLHAPRDVWQRIIEQSLDEVNHQMSTWLDDSVVSRFNAGPPGSWHQVPSAFCDVLQCALLVAQASDGAFDPTIGELVELWGFGARCRYNSPGYRPPGAKAIGQALRRKGWAALRYEHAKGLIHQPGGLKLDFSGVAKGYAVDRVSLALQAGGIGHCLVEIGGELRGVGMKPDGQPWWIRLESPEPEIPYRGSSNLPETRVALHELSVATSGDYRRYFFSRLGARQPHTIDPRTGYPVVHNLASVSVVHGECMWADAWATALTALGPNAGYALATLQELPALFVSRLANGGFEERTTPALQAMMQ